MTEVFLALPATILLLAVIGVIGVKIYIIMAILGVLISAAVYRVMLGVAQSVRQRLYVDAARVNGLGSLRVNLVHVLPSMATVVAVQAAQLYGIGLLIVAGLAFLGLRARRARAQLGLHDPGRLLVRVQRAVADGADRPRPRAHRGRGQRARRRHRRQGLRGADDGAAASGRSPGAVAAATARRRPGATRTRSSRSAISTSPSTTGRRWSPASPSPSSPAGCSAWSGSPAAARR